MFGFYRFFLALLVVNSHFRIIDPPKGLNVGAWAVINFFIISGYVMTALLRRSYTPLGPKTWFFYVDRALRIFPQFLFFLSLTAIAALIWHFPALKNGITIEDFLLNALVIPNNYYMYLPNMTLIIPDTWSLGAEEQFYLLFPFILLIRRLFWPTFLLSLSVFTCAAFGILDTDYFGYRLIVGTTWIFLTGSLLFDLQDKPSLKKYVILAAIYVYILVIGFCVLKWAVPHLYNAEVFTGLAIGIPIIFVLSRFQPGPIDNIWGRASYGIFLSHILVIWMLEHFIPSKNYTLQTKLYVPLISIALGFFGSYVVENPFFKMRHTLRNRMQKYL